jgi:phosphopantetheinyl transferase
VNVRFLDDAVLARVAFGEAPVPEDAVERAFVEGAWSEERRHELTAGRAAARRAFEAAGCAPAPRVGADGAGRPVADMAGWHVSIAHDGRVAFAAVAARPVGIDAIALDRTGDVVRVVTARISSGRAKPLVGAAPLGFERAMLLWSAWEALGKRTGGGILSGPMRLDIATVPVDDGAVACVGEARLRWFVDQEHLVCLATSECP